MPHVLLQRLNVISGHDAVDGKCMPQIMHTVMLQAGFFQQFLEFLPYCRLRK